MQDLRPSTSRAICWGSEMTGNILFALASSLVFGLGLIVAGMADPSKVLAFLDLAGNWDPSLAVVMAAAISIATVGFRIARLRRIDSPTAASKSSSPTPSSDSMTDRSI